MILQMGEAEAEVEPNAPRLEVLAYSVREAVHGGGVGRSTLYKAMDPDPGKREGLPFLPSFTVGRRRLILAADHREWLAKLRAASLAELRSDRTI